MPGSVQMILSSEQPELMCPGEKVTYECNVGGINVREDQKKNSYFHIPCLQDNSYKSVPEEDWPVCIDRMDCNEPEYNELVLTSSYNPGDSLTPTFTIDYECIRPGKKVIKIKDLAQANDQDMVDVLTVTCYLNGTYDVDIEEFTCTNPCQPPQLPEPDKMEHDWPHDYNLEIGQEVRHKCKDGRKLVSKNAFKEGKESPFLDEIMSSCQVDGALNQTIGAYTCTRGCEIPRNHSSVFTWDWDESKGTEIGVEVTYICNDPTRQIVSKGSNSKLILTELVSTCLYNGEYEFDIFEFECTECLKRPDPPNGKILCESNKFLAGSTCVLECDPGYIPLGETLVTCLWDISEEDFSWDIEASLFICVEPIGLVIGGIAKDYTYLNEVETLAPDMSCNGQILPDYPLKVIGASAGFILGQNLVCGGARYDYTDCSLHSEGSDICDRNVDCIKTYKGPEWCTGPKTNKCFTYEPVLKVVT